MPLKQADLVVALGGDRERQQEAVRLLDSGLAQWVLFVGSDVGPDDYAFLRVSPDRTISPPLSAYSTYDEATVVRKVIQEKGIRSVLIVTYPYHFRRALLAFERALKGTQVSITVAPAPLKDFSMNEWWRSSEGWKAVFMEYVALLYYRFSL